MPPPPPKKKKKKKRKKKNHTICRGMFHTESTPGAKICPIKSNLHQVNRNTTRDNEPFKVIYCKRYNESCFGSSLNREIEAQGVFVNIMCL